MRASNTVVLERLKYVSDDFHTEPYETAWAKEAIFFIRLHEVIGNNTALQSYVQLSPDGVNWIDEGSAFPIMKTEENQFLRVNHFGGWLRLSCFVSGENPKLKLTIHLVLKS